MGLNEILSIIAYLLTAVSIGITIYTKIKKNKETAKSKDSQSMLAKAVSIANIVAEIPNAIKKAERVFGAGNGSAKLEMAVQDLKISAIEHECYESFDEQMIRSKIEEILETPQKKTEGGQA